MDTCLKTLAVQLPEALVAEIEVESRQAHRSRSGIVRKRLNLGVRPRSRHALSAAITITLHLLPLSPHFLTNIQAGLDRGIHFSHEFRSEGTDPPLETGFIQRKNLSQIDH